ncbi:hypothetical protein CB0940_10224 [Cercospora beticola]|uniref:Uncharacterized protein n=1 Tax=Cercospora beticola TaxID=122368 RepID=A0A2G5HUV1_CERBT|nr:hypothetical protein CB0940_10224 [Cercospora beticola]PIA96301.1 hypothetical protein CB0940_10224 [Cercospora beticola]WPB06935.1 hypothetical protein RHO25_011595 [Cercospora beticola]
MAAILLYEIKRQQTDFDMRAIAHSLHRSCPAVDEAQALSTLERMEDEGSRLFHLEVALGRGAIFVISCAGTEIIGKKDFRKTGPEFEQAVAKFREAGATQAATRFAGLRDALAGSMSPELCLGARISDDLPSRICVEGTAADLDWDPILYRTDDNESSRAWSVDWTA